MIEKLYSALISYEGLNAFLQQDDPGLVLLDATFVLPNTPIDPSLVFQNKRIGTAQYFDITDIADHASPLPHMLPSEDVFAEKVAGLGISNDSRVIIYGQEGIAMGPARAWWMFRIFGHQNVQILNGSLNDWEAKGHPVIAAPPQTPAQTQYNAVLQPDMVISITEVDKASREKACPILDARPITRFSGETAEPRPGMRAGHIPNSCNIPAGQLIDPNTGGLKNSEDLRASIPKELLSKGPILTCGSGVTACVIALALFELGSEDWRVFDGSWSEWGQSSFPVETSART